MKTFENLRAGDRITNPLDGEMEVLYWNYFGNGKIMCFADGKNIYPATEFSPEDWEIVKRK